MNYTYIAQEKLNFIQDAKATVSGLDESLVSRAWDFAYKQHITQPRETGESYFSHPVSVARSLFDVWSDSESIAAALLHDVVEDTDASIQDISKICSPAVASLVDGVTKLSVLDFPPNERLTKEKVRHRNLRKLFVSIADDPRVALIKLADRMHNLATLGALSRERQVRLARESLEIFAPMAEALGLGIFHTRIQEMAFRWLEPDIYNDLKQKIEERFVDFDETKKIAIHLLEDELDKLGIKGFVYGRQKEIYSIYRKMVALDLSFEEVHDIIGLRIIVTSKEDCYRAK